VRISPLPIAGLLEIQLDVHADSRGFFVERFNLRDFEAAGLASGLVQDNHTRSAPRVLRGLHYQREPAQAKFVGVIRGRIWDVAVDIRPDSPTFGRHHAQELSGENGKLLWIPAGFAHGFCVLGEEPADVTYKVDRYYQRDGEGGIHWADPRLAIPWPVRDPIVSARDAALPAFTTSRFA
jgi:dTDP-4-dehydrorhamnose 3,5-epimerase